MSVQVVSTNTLSGLHGIDIDWGAFFRSPLGSSIQDASKNIAINVSRNIGRTHETELIRFGRSISKSGIAQLLQPFPPYVKDYVMPGYVEPKPLPTWIGQVTNPIMNPVIYGVKAEAFQLSQRLVPLAIGSVFLILLTSFAGGYILGSVTRRTS